MYQLSVGLEIHAELKTQTKMFCACRNNPDEKTPNLNVCPVCLAHPGTLPVINKEAVRKVLAVGRAVGGVLADYTEFDRKNYFYPDIPKGYQISQYRYPLVRGGSIGGIELTRIHLEEDTARSQHFGNPDSGGAGDRSLIDYNRAGVPLMELVTEPVIHGAQEAGAFARELQLLLRYIGAGEANMEKGEMRVEANISVSKDDTLGTKVEVKNLNSFRSVERAIAYEYERQSKLLEEGGVVVQETRGWDEIGQKTLSQRKKEGSADYRYFPDPDLPKLSVSALPDLLAGDLPMLPWQRREQYLALGLKRDDADMFVNESHLGDFFDAVVAEVPAQASVAANYIANDLAGSGVLPSHQEFAALLKLLADGSLSSRGVKETLNESLTSSEALTVIARKYLQQNDQGALDAFAQEAIAQNPQVVADYKAGKEAALQFLVGQGMKLSKGSANPAALRETLAHLLA